MHELRQENVRLQKQDKNHIVDCFCAKPLKKASLLSCELCKATYHGLSNWFWMIRLSFSRKINFFQSRVHKFKWRKSTIRRRTVPCSSSVTLRTGLYVHVVSDALVRLCRLSWICWSRWRITSSGLVRVIFCKRLLPVLLTGRSVTFENSTVIIFNFNVRRISCRKWPKALCQTRRTSWTSLRSLLW